MPQYQVPQFIDIEDKVFGPLTIRQFGYIAAAGVVVMLFYKFFRTWVLITIGFPFGGLMLALAFYKHKGVPFPKVLKNALYFAFSRKLYLWKKKEAAGSEIPDIERALFNKVETTPRAMMPPPVPPTNKI